MIILYVYDNYHSTDYKLMSQGLPGGRRAGRSVPLGMHQTLDAGSRHLRPNRLIEHKMIEYKLI